MAKNSICSALAGFMFVGCATLQQLSALVQAPRFEQAPDRDPENPGSSAPGPACRLAVPPIRLWTKVTNPNAFSLTLGTLKGTLYLDESHAADADFPLGLPLNGGGESIVPIDLLGELCQHSGPRRQHQARRHLAERSRIASTAPSVSMPAGWARRLSGR